MWVARWRLVGAEQPVGRSHLSWGILIHARHGGAGIQITVALDVPHCLRVVALRVAGPIHRLAHQHMFASLALVVRTLTRRL